MGIPPIIRLVNRCFLKFTSFHLFARLRNCFLKLIYEAISANRDT